MAGGTMKNALIIVFISSVSELVERHIVTNLPFQAAKIGEWPFETGKMRITFLFVLKSITFVSFLIYSKNAPKGT